MTAGYSCVSENKNVFFFLERLKNWVPLPVEVFELLRLYQLFVDVTGTKMIVSNTVVFLFFSVHRIENIPSDSPSLVITNHALGHRYVAYEGN